VFGREKDRTCHIKEDLPTDRPSSSFPDAPSDFTPDSVGFSAALHLEVRSHAFSRS